MTTRSAVAAEILYGVCLVLAISFSLYAWGAWSWYPTNPLVFAIGAVAGGLAGFFLRPALSGLFAQAANPDRSLKAVLFCVAFLVGGLTAGGLLHLNGALDSSEPEVRTGVVTSVGGARKLERRATVRWQDGDTSTFRVSSDTREGSVVTQARHSGALGWTWAERPVIRRR